ATVLLPSLGIEEVIRITLGRCSVSATLRPNSIPRMDSAKGDIGSSVMMLGIVDFGFGRITSGAVASTGKDKARSSCADVRKPLTKSSPKSAAMKPSNNDAGTAPAR